MWCLSLSPDLKLKFETHNLRVWLDLANEFGPQTHTELITWTQSQTLKSNLTHCHARRHSLQSHHQVMHGLTVAFQKAIWVSCELWIYSKKSSRVTSCQFCLSSSSPSIRMEDRRFCLVCSFHSVCSCSLPSSDEPLGPGVLLGRAIFLDSVLVQFSVVVWRFSYMY